MRLCEVKLGMLTIYEVLTGYCTNADRISRCLSRRCAVKWTVLRLDFVIQSASLGIVAHTHWAPRKRAVLYTRQTAVLCCSTIERSMCKFKQNSALAIRCKISGHSRTIISWSHYIYFSKQDLIKHSLDWWWWWWN